jgi:microcystin degradation protein MlrC
MKLYIGVLLCTGLLVLAPVALAAGRPPRIAVMRLRHETVTFLPNDTTRDDFIYPGSPAQGEALLNSESRGAMGGFVKVAREYGAELTGIESPGMPRTGTGSGWVTQDAYEHFVGRMLAGLKEQGPFDGVYLNLHGAMAVRGIPRPEAELARRVREVVGDGVVIAGTFDPHGNEDEAFLQHADLAFTYKYYPHYDTYLQGERAARMLIRTIRGDYRPAHAVRTVPILSATVYQWTGQHPWSTLVQRCLTWEAREPDVYVNFFFGFPWSDVPDAGMSFQVITNGKPDLARAVAADLAETAWRLRAEMFAATPVHPVGEAIGILKQALAEGRKPAVLADYSDRSGNAVWVLREIIEQDVEKAVIATVRDDRALAALAAAGAKAGDPFDAEVGGYMDSSAGEPVRVRGVLERFTTAQDGRALAAHVRFGQGNLLMISPQLVQVTSPGSLRAEGVDVEEFEVFAIKSRVHFRRGFDDNGFAKTILLVEPPGKHMGTVHLDALPYENLRVSDYYPFGRASTQ